MGDYPTNERRPCELRAPGAGGTRVRIQTGRWDVGRDGTASRAETLVAAIYLDMSD